MLRLLHRAPGYNRSYRFIVSIGREESAVQALQRLNNCYIRSSVNNRGDPEQALHDLQTLHDQALVIPKHYFAYGYFLAVHARDPYIAQKVTDLVLRNHPLHPPSSPSRDHILQETLGIGIQESINHSQYSLAYAIWAQSEAHFTHTHTKQFLLAVNRGKTRFYLEKKYFQKVVSAVYSDGKVYEKYMALVPILHTLHSSALSSSTSSLSLQSQDNTSTSTSTLLLKANELLEQILLSPSPPPLTRGWKGELREHFACLAQAQQFPQIFHFSEQILLRYAPEVVKSPREGVNEIGGEMDELLALLSLPRGEDSPPLYPKGGFRLRPPRSSLSDVREWLRESLLYSFYKGALGGQGQGQGQGKGREGRGGEGAPLSLSDLIRERVGALTSLTNFMTKVGIVADARSLFFLLESIAKRVEKDERIVADAQEQGLCLAPASPLRLVMSFLEEGQGQGQGGRGGREKGRGEGRGVKERGEIEEGEREGRRRLVEGVVKIFTARPAAGGAGRGLVSFLERQLSLSPPLPPLPSTFALLVRERETPLLSPPALRLLDHLLERGEASGLYPPAALLSLRFQVQKLLPSPLSALSLLKMAGERGLPLGRECVKLTVETCLSLSPQEREGGRFWRGAGGVAEWMHLLGSARGLYGSDEGVRILLPLFVKGVEVLGEQGEQEEGEEGEERGVTGGERAGAGAGARGERAKETAEARERILKDMNNFLSRHWSKLPPSLSPPSVSPPLLPSSLSSSSPTPCPPWTPLDEQVLRMAMTAWCQGGQREGALAFLLSLQSHYEGERVLSPLSLFPVLQHLLEEGEVEQGMTLLTSLLLPLSPPQLTPEVLSLFVDTLAQGGDPRGALDLAQEYYYQCAVRPSFRSLVSLLWLWKRRGDVQEAGRVRDFMRGVYGGEWVKNAEGGYREGVGGKRKGEEERERGGMGLSFW